jgi:hypothetical protein
MACTISFLAIQDIAKDGRTASRLILSITQADYTTLFADGQQRNRLREKSIYPETRQGT